MATTDTPSHHWQRLRQQTQELVEDLRAWVELRLTLTQMEIEERIETQIRRLLLRLLIGALAGLAAVFVLVAVALGLGAWLGHTGWGFLVVALGLMAVAAGLHFSRRRSSKAVPTATPAGEPDRAANA
ncbi:phage holin family protein [Rhodothermus profundi]|nr:phage holin family protein [Rhodothermus profundi]